MEPAKLTVDAITNLAVYGPLGTLALLCIVGMIVMYKDMCKERQRHKDELKEREEEHAKEQSAERAVFAVERESWRVQLATEREAWRVQLNNERKVCEDERREARVEYQKLDERYITKTERQLDKYQELTTALKDVMGSAMRRMRPARDSDVGGGRDDT